MPSENFLHLNDKKRGAILDAALDQFSKKSFRNMRVSSFIRQAHVSRASFYIYFEDKKDLYRAVLRWLCEEAAAVFTACLQEEKGCFYEASLRTVNELTAQEKWKDCAAVCREILEDRTCRRLAFEVGAECRETERRRRFLARCCKEADKSRYPKAGEEAFACVVDLAAGLLLKTLAAYALENPDREEMRKSLRCQLMILDKALQNMSGPDGDEAE